MSNGVKLQRAYVLIFFAVIFVMLLILSGVIAYDRTTWLLEIFPILIGLPIVVATYKNFPLTNLLYFLLFLHALVLMVGGIYTYARVPMGYYLAKLLHIHRNPYDKVGHFFQGFVPALIAREILLRKGFLRHGKMLVFLCICVVMTVSSLYELIEWAAAVMLGQGADDFLGTQGDPWDTQSDMLFALIGGCSALTLMPYIHDQQINTLMDMKS